jgi:hypothetical protein
MFTYIDDCFKTSQYLRNWRAHKWEIVENSCLADQDIEELLMDFDEL